MSVPNWTEIKSDPNVSALPAEERQLLLDQWERDTAEELAASPKLDREGWESFRIGTALERAELSGQEFNPDEVVKTTSNEIRSSYKNLPYFNSNPKALYDDAEFEKVLPTIGNPLERAEARATRLIARDQKESDWASRLDTELKDLLDQAAKDSKGKTLGGTTVGNGDWDGIGLWKRPADGAEYFRILKPTNETGDAPQLMANGLPYAREVTDLTEQIRAEGGDPEVIIDRLKKARVWGNAADPGNLVRKLDNGRVIFNPQATKELFEPELVDREINALGVPDAEKQGLKDQATTQRKQVASQLVNSLEFGSASAIDSINPVGLAANAAELIGLKSDFNAFRAANDEKFGSDEELVSAYYKQVKDRPGIVRALDAYSSGIYAGTQQFALGVAQVPVAVGLIGATATGIGEEETASAFNEIQNLQQLSQESLAATGGETTAMVARTSLDLASMVATGGLSSGAVRSGGTVANKLASRVATRMAANASEKATLGAAFETAIARNVDDIALKVGRVVGEGTAAVQSGSGMFGESYSKNLSNNLEAVKNLPFASPEERDVALAQAREDAVWSATKDGLAGGVITTALMRLVPGGFESVLGKKLAAEPGNVTIGSLLKDVSATNLRTAFRNPEFRSAAGKLAGEIGMEAGREAVEEGADEAIQGLWAANRYNPDMKVSEFVSQVGTAALLGGVFGGAVNVGQSALTQGDASFDTTPPAAAPAQPATTTTTPPVAAASATPAVTANPVVTPSVIDPAVTAPETALTEQEIADRDATVQSDVDELLVAANTEAPPAPVEIADAITSTAVEVAPILPETAAVLEEIAAQNVVIEEVAVEDEVIDTSPATPKPGDTVVWGTESEETMMPEYRNVRFVSINPAGGVVVNDGTKDITVDPSDLTMDDRVVDIPGAIARRASGRVGTPTISSSPEVSSSNDPTNSGPASTTRIAPVETAQAPGNQGIDEPRLDTSAGNPNVAVPESTVTEPARRRVRSAPEELVTQVRATGIVPSSGDLRTSVKGTKAQRDSARLELANEVLQAFPLADVPSGATNYEGKTYFTDSKRKVKFPVNLETREGYFTNDPETTAAQLMNHYSVVVPPAARATLNPAIEINEAGEVVSVAHPKSFVGRVLASDTTNSVAQRYTSSPDVKRRSRDQLNSSLSEESQAERSAIVEAANQTVASNPVATDLLTTVQLKREDSVRRLQADRGLGATVAEEIVDTAIDEYTLRLSRSEAGNEGNLSFKRILNSAVDNYFVRQARIENAFDVDTRPTSLDAAPVENEALDIEFDTTADEFVSDEFANQGDEEVDTVAPTLEENRIFSDLYTRALADSERGIAGLIDAENTSPEEAVEILLETVDSIDDALSEGNPRFTAEEAGIGQYLQGLRQSEPEVYEQTIETFRAYATRFLESPTTLRTRSITNAQTTAPLMSNIKAMNDLGIVPGDSATLESALGKLANDLNIPKFYRNSAAYLLRSLAGRMPNFRVVSTDAGYAGEYNTATNTVIANMARDNGQGFIGMLMHELTHASEAQILQDPLSEFDEAMIAEMRAMKDNLTARLPDIDKEIKAYKLEMLKELGIKVVEGDPLLNQILLEAEADIFYALGYDYDPVSQTYAERGLSSDNNADLQELVAHYFTDPMFRFLAGGVSVEQGNLGSELQGIIASMIAGARTAANSVRGKAIALAAGWNLMSPRSMPDSNNLYGRPVETIRSVVQDWNVPLATEPSVVPTVETVSDEITRRSPDTFQSRASVFSTDDSNLPYRKIDPAQVGGFRPSGLLGFGATPKDVALALQLKRNTEGAAQTAAKFFKRSLDSFLKKNPGQAQIVNSALGNTDVKVTDAQWKASQQVYEAAKAIATTQFQADLVNVRAARAAGNTAAASTAYTTAVDNVRIALNQAYQDMVNNRARFRQANVAAAKLRQTNAIATITNLDPVFADTLTTFRARLDALSAEVARATGLSPELRGAITDNQGIYLHRAYRLFENPKYQDKLMEAYGRIGTPPSPGQVDPLRMKVEAALVAINEEVVEERSRWIRKDARDGMIYQYAQANNVDIPAATQALRTTPNPMSKAAADTLAKDWTENTEDGQMAVERKFISYAEARETVNPDVAVSNRISKDTSVKADIVKNRKDLPKWLRELWGEYEDPYVNATNTLMELTAYTAQEKYLRDLVQQGTSVANGATPFLTTAVPDTDGNVLVQLPGVNTSGWVKITEDEKSPLAGYYAHPFTKQVLTGVQGHQASSSKLVRAFHKLTGLAMAAKTVYSVQSHARNFFGNTFFVAANGNVFAGGLGNVIESGKDTSALLFGTSNQDRQLFVEKLQRLGVLKDNQVIEILNQVAEQAGSINFDTEDSGGLVAWLFEKVAAFDSGVKNAYQAGDDFWKAFAFRAERAKVEAWGTNMTDDQIDAEAARRVRLTMPTYSMAPEVIKIIRSTGVVGAFVTFVAESVRITANTVKLSVEDFKAAPIGSPRSNQGASRLAALTFWQGIIGASIGPMASAVFAGIAHLAFGDKEDDEIEKTAINKILLAARKPPSNDEIRALRKFLPDWQKDAQLWVIGKDPDGNVSYTDISYLNPYSFFSDIVVAGYRGIDQPGESAGKRITDAAKNVGKRTIAPFFGEQLFFGAIADTVFGDKVINSNAPIWSEGDAGRIVPMLLYGKKDATAGNLISGANHIWTQAFLPGTLRSAQRIVAGSQGYTAPNGRKFSTEFEVASVFGLAKVETMDPRQSIADTMRNDLGRLTYASGTLTRVAGSRGSVSDATITQAVTTAEDNQADAYKQLRKTYDAGLALGVSPEEIKTAAEKNRIGDNILKTVVKGVYKPEPPTRATLKTIQASVPRGETQNRTKLILDAYADQPVRDLTTDD